MIAVYDGFVDTLKGLGQASGTQPRAVYSDTARELGIYESLYESDWLARRIVQIFPEDAMRKRATIDDVSEEEADQIWRRFGELNRTLLYPHGVLSQGLYQGRAMAGALILLGFREFGEVDQRAPAPEGRGLAWLDVVPWKDVTVTSYVDDWNRPDHGLPEIVKISADHPRNGLEIHLSRTIPCEGLPRATWEKGDLTPWISVLQPVYEVIRDYGLSWEAASLLLQESSIGVMKLQGLIGAIASKKESVLKARADLISMSRSTARTIFLDADGNEDFKRTEVTFTGVDRILEQLQMRVCGAAKVPHTRLFGRSPDGMSATGESDMQIFYSEVSQYQEISVRPKLERLLSLVARKPITVTFPPLYELTGKEAAEVRLTHASADEKYYDLGVLEAEDIGKSRSADGSLGVKIANLERFDAAGQTP